MATLYVIEQGARIEKEYQRILVTKEDKVLQAVPLRRVSHVVLVGNVGTTTPALLVLLKADVGLSLVNRWGKLRGMLMPATGKNIKLRQKQYARASEPAFCLALGREIVQGKLRNERNLARRLLRSHKDQVNPALIGRIDQALAGVRSAKNLGELRGLEGGGAKAYFAIFRQSLEVGYGFDKRTRRPPTDPVNALLSLGYSLLTQNLITACEVVGLDPYEGYFHSDKYGRPALALDLVEEFRHIVVDSVVLNLINRNMVDERDFEPGAGGGVYLKEHALRIYFEQYTQRLNTEVVHPLAGRALSYQKIFEVQARQLRKLIEGEMETYEPFLTR